VHGAATILPLLRDTAFTFPASLLFPFALFEHLLRPLQLLLLSFFFPGQQLGGASAILLRTFLSFGKPPEASANLRAARKYYPYIFLGLNHSRSDELLLNHPWILFSYCTPMIASRLQLALSEDRGCGLPWLSIPGCTELRRLSYRSIAMHDPLLLCSRREYLPLQPFQHSGSFSLSVGF
jgi:hypothetical protein